MVTIKDVAKRASVSVSTASRILSSSTSERFSEATQAKVLRASLELGYRPNFAARALVSGRTHIVAAVFPRGVDTPFTAPASLQILSSIESFCSDNGYHLLLSSPKLLNGNIDVNFINLLAGGYLDGLIIDGHFDVTPVMQAVARIKIPAVILGYHPHKYYLRSDNFLGGKLIMQHVIEHGHKHIGIIGITRGNLRLDGMRAAAKSGGLDFDSMPRIDGSFSESSGADAARDLITKHPELTAIIAWNDRMAFGAIRQLRTMGFDVPGHISVAGHDDLPHSANNTPPLTTINQLLPEWGKMAMQMLLDVIDGEEPESREIEPRLIQRDSVGPPRTA